MKTVLVDQDGVLADWTGTLNTRLAEMFPHIPVVAPENIKEFKIYKAYASEHKESIMKVMDSERFYADLEPLPGMREAMEGMQAEGLDVRICTSPFVTNYGCASEKLAWVKEHLGTKWMDRVILTGDKTFIRGDVLVDDKSGIHGFFLDGVNSPTWKQVVFAHSHNVGAKDINGNLLPRLEDWSQWRGVILPLVR